MSLLLVQPLRQGQVAGLKHHSLHDQMNQVVYTQSGKTENRVTDYGARNRNSGKMPSHRLAFVPRESSVVLVSDERVLA
jgi:hypothetical protein